jgi:hypothetical protein
MASRIKTLPSPAMIVAIIALVMAAVGTSYAAVGLPFLSKDAKIQTVGSGPLVYSTNNGFVPAGQTVTVRAACPPKLRPVGGGVRVSTGTQAGLARITDSFPVRGGWVATVSNLTATESHTAVVTAICAKSLRARGTIAG